MKKTDNNTVFITGATGNLGKATVDRFLAGGYKVIATSSPGKGAALSQPNVELHEVDLSDEDAVDEVVSDILARHPSLHAALFLAGGYAHGGIDDTDFARLDRMITVNFNTAFFAAQRIFQHMLAKHEGRLVFVGARAGIDPKAGASSFAYGLSKSLLFHLAEVLNASNHGTNVTASVVVPSTIDTPQNRTAMPKADFSKWVKADHIAETLFLICDPRTQAWREPVIKIYGNG